MKLDDIEMWEGSRGKILTNSNHGPRGRLVTQGSRPECDDGRVMKENEGDYEHLIVLN